MRRTTTLLSIAFLTACADAGTAPAVSTVRIEPTAATYIAGDSVWVAIYNVGDDDVLYNLCERARQRAENGTWGSDAVGGANCLDFLGILHSGASARWLVEKLPEDITPGVYRYQFSGLHVNDSLLPANERVSSAFRVVVR